MVPNAEVRIAGQRPANGPGGRPAEGLAAENGNRRPSPTEPDLRPRGGAERWSALARRLPRYLEPLHGGTRPRHW
jgi:hypothetical protein